MERRDDRGRVGVNRREFLERTIEIGAGLAVLGGCVPRFGVRETASPSGALEARYGASGDELSLSNDAIAAAWSVANGSLRALRMHDVRGGSDLEGRAVRFSLELADGSALTSDICGSFAVPIVESLAARRDASRFNSRLAERQAGRQVTVILEDDSHRMRATWRAVLRDGSPYVRQEIVLEALGEPLAVREISLIDLRATDAKVSGTVKGSPIVAGTGTWDSSIRCRRIVSTAIGRDACCRGNCRCVPACRSRCRR